MWCQGVYVAKSLYLCKKMKIMKRVCFVVFLVLSFCVFGQRIRMVGGPVDVTLDATGFFHSVKMEGAEVLTKAGLYPMLMGYSWQLVLPAKVAQHGDTLLFVMDDGGKVELQKTSAKGGLSFEVLSCPDEYKSLIFGPMNCRSAKAGLAFVPNNCKMQTGLPRLAKDAVFGQFFHDSMLLDNALQCYVLNLQGRGGMPWAGPVRNCRAAWIDPVPGAEGAIVGAKMTMGVRPSQATKPARIVAEFNGGNIDSLILVCKQQHVKYLVHPNAFRSLGHYQWRADLAKDDAEMRSLVAYAASKGVHLGVRIWANHVSVNDAYVTPLPSAHLLRQLQFQLISPAEASDSMLVLLTGLNSCFVNDMPCNLVRVDDEIIVYDSIIDDEGLVHLMGCRRGALGTTAAFHKSGSLGARLWTLDSATLMADAQLLSAIADRIVDMVNATGMQMILFDDMEDMDYLGHGGYGAQRWMERCVAGFDHPVIAESNLW